jgi:hypothetical protein
VETPIRADLQTKSCEKTVRDGEERLYRPSLISIITSSPSARRAHKIRNGTLQQPIFTSSLDMPESKQLPYVVPLSHASASSSAPASLPLAQRLVFSAFAGMGEHMFQSFVGIKYSRDLSNSLYSLYATK